SLAHRTTWLRSDLLEEYLMSIIMQTLPSPLVRLGLLSNGIRVSADVQEAFQKYIKEPLRTRAGAGGGLDIILEDGTWVNAPTLEDFAENSPYYLDVYKGEFFIKARGEAIQKVTFPKRPEYYDMLTSDGVPMSKVGVMLGDRLAISITNACLFWGTQDVCKYCSIGLNKEQDLTFKKVDQIVETVVQAVSEGSANHVAINAGGLPGKDRGAKTYAKYARAIREKIDVHIAAQLLPPEELDYVDLLKEAGYSEATYDVEVFDWERNWAVSEGKAKIGLDHYLKVLERAVKVFGRGNVTSNLIVGLESPESTAKGAEVFASMGVVPKLIIFRPLNGTPLAKEKAPSVYHMIETYKLANSAVKKNDGKLGPLCTACNINRLAFPYDVDFDELLRVHGDHLAEIETNTVVSR
ncbi:hypothetical protein PTB13_11790, partial [Bacillus sp. MHSD17]|nr:hypothetical protein [Bacillus sp. MHSD17]